MSGLIWVWLCVAFGEHTHLLLDAVSRVHVFDVIEAVTDGVHEVEVLTVLIHCLQHLVERHADLKVRTHTHTLTLAQLR